MDNAGMSLLFLYIRIKLKKYKRVLFDN